MADKIFPSKNDVGPVAGDGRIATEASLADWRNSAAAPFSHYRDGEQVSPGGVLSGFDFSSGTAISVTLTAGTAVIEGYKVEDTDTIVGTLTASLFNFVFLALTKSSGLVTGLELQVRTAATFDAALASVPPDAILIWCFETDAGVIVTQFDFRAMESGVISGSYIGDDAATRTINLGFRPKLVQIHRNDESGLAPKFVAQSPLAIPRASGQQSGLFVAHPNYAVITNDPEHVPALVEDGFTIEDGPGTPEAPRWLEGSKTHDFPSLAGHGTLSTTITVTGARANDICVVDLSSLLATQPLILRAQVTSNDTVTIILLNASTGSVNVDSGTLSVGVHSKVFEPKLNELNQIYYFVAWY